MLPLGFIYAFEVVVDFTLLLRPVSNSWAQVILLPQPGT